MSKTQVWILRLFGLLPAVWIMAVSIRFAVADFYAHPRADRPDAVERLTKAIGMRPSNAEYLLWKAQAEMSGMAASDDIVRADFEKVLTLDRRNSEALMNLGILAQRAGDSAKAEAYLLQAVELDRTFKPVWTLTNHYFQTGQFDKMWPRITQTLKIADPGLEGLARFSAKPIFELCRRAGATPQQILALTPERQGLLLHLFFDALERKDWDTGLLVFPKALAVSDASDIVQRNAYSGFCGGLLNMHRTPEALEVWNRLIERGMVKSTLLHPEMGESLADPGLLEGPSTDPFGWLMKTNPHAVVSHDRGLLQVEFDGREDESYELLTKNLPVLKGRTYTFRWKADIEGVKREETGESGFAVHFISGDAEMAERCPDLIGPANTRECRFRTPADSDLVRMIVLYRRPLGSRRFTGTISMTGFGLDLQAH